ncbi:hypothetical protein E5C33_21145 [Stenotrophomonas maltophilia]|uniref:hypothetical protein n=1 Tax=Stenotrophomonas maltophilia TaxID=40324 RepID=UPI001075D2B5|nr:hypothetical protein [Stenotrophomonas maltophilia]TFZ42021.1 hypothetical protein E5C33_21145 [Stenotrophomonas maltophilia]
MFIAVPLLSIGALIASAALAAQRAVNAAAIFERTSCVMSRRFCHQHAKKGLTKSAGSLEFAPLLQRIASSETAREQRRHHRRTR